MARGRRTSEQTESQLPREAPPSTNSGAPPRAAKRSGAAPSRTIINFWLDCLLLLLFLSLLVVSVILRFVFPSPSASRGWRLWGAGYDGWSDLQFTVLCLLSGAILLHVMLHWTWVCGVIWTRLLGSREGRRRKLPDDGARTLLGVGTMIVLLNLMGLLIAAAALSIRGP